MNKSALSVFAGLLGLSFAKSKSGNSNESNYTATVHVKYKIQNTSFEQGLESYFVVENGTLLMQDWYDLASAWNKEYPIRENIYPNIERGDMNIFLREFIFDKMKGFYPIWREYLEEYFSWYINDKPDYGSIPFIGFFKKFFYNEKFDIEIKGYKYKRSKDPSGNIDEETNEDYDISVTFVFKNIKSISPLIYAEIYNYILDFIHEEYSIVYSVTGGVEMDTSIVDIVIEDNFPPSVRVGKIFLNSLHNRTELRRF